MQEFVGPVVRDDGISTFHKGVIEDRSTLLSNSISQRWEVDTICDGRLIYRVVPTQSSRGGNGARGRKETKYDCEVEISSIGQRICLCISSSAELSCALQTQKVAMLFAMIPTRLRRLLPAPSLD